MSGISASTCISLILQHIGGIPLMGTFRTITEGSPLAKQLGGSAFSIPSLSMLSGALNGIPAASMLTSTFQNPIGDITSNLTSSITSVTSNLEATFVTELSNVTGQLERAIKPEFANVISLDQLDSLKENMGNLSGSIPSLEDITDKMSGVKMPTFEDGLDFGMQQVASITTSFDTLASRIPAELDAQVGGLKQSIGEHLDNIAAPLNTGVPLSNVNDITNNLVNSLTSATSANEVAAIINSANSSFSDTKSLIDGAINTSKSTMNTFVEGARVIGQVDVISGTIQGGSDRSKEFVNMITKPEAMQQIKDGVELQKKYFGFDAAPIDIPEEPDTIET